MGFRLLIVGLFVQCSLLGNHHVEKTSNELTERICISSHTDIIYTYNEVGMLVQKGYLTNGLPDGLWQRFHQDGSLHMEGTFYKGKKVGNWKVYHQNELLYVISYKKNKVTDAYSTE